MLSYVHFYLLLKSLQAFKVAASACKALFKEGKTNGVLMTDGALTYRLVKPAGIVEHFTVNHTEHEYSRSEDIIKDVVTKERRAGMAGTQFLDHEWRMLKRELYNLRIKRYAEKFAMLSKTTANSILAGHTAVLIATFLLASDPFVQRQHAVMEKTMLIKRTKEILSSIKSIGKSSKRLEQHTKPEFLEECGLTALMGRESSEVAVVTEADGILFSTGP